MAEKQKVVGGKCGCPSVLCGGSINGVAQPPRNVWVSRTNKHGRGYGRNARKSK